MRMWNIYPPYLCRNHLLGEHKELHMFDGCIRRTRNLRGYMEKGLVEIHNIVDRHNELVIEMLKRGYNHQSPLEKWHPFGGGKVDLIENIKELRKRCVSCRERMDEQK